MPGMMRRQMRRRAIVGTAMTASMVSGARKNRAERKAIENYNDQQSAQADDMSAQGGQSDLTAQLEELNRLKNQGILTEEEFQAKKKQLLGI